MSFNDPKAQQFIASLKENIKTPASITSLDPKLISMISDKLSSSDDLIAYKFTIGDFKKYTNTNIKYLNHECKIKDDEISIKLTIGICNDYLGGPQIITGNIKQFYVAIAKELFIIYKDLSKKQQQQTKPPIQIFDLECIIKNSVITFLTITKMSNTVAEESPYLFEENYF
jgi:hypothetical protein